MIVKLTVLLALICPSIALESMHRHVAHRWMVASPSRSFKSAGAAFSRDMKVHYPKRLVARQRPWKNCRLSSTSNENTYGDHATQSTKFVLNQVQQSLSEILQQVNHSDSDEPTLLLVGLSGGCDSVGLLHALVQIFPVIFNESLPNKIELRAVHFDHKQRGVESDGDRYFVTELCKTLGVPLHIHYWDAENSFSQEVGRTWRINTMCSLLETLRPNQQGVILTAHHKDDSMETLLLKLLRGVHITNLTGMELYVSMQNAILGRPMLRLSKVQIRTFLESHQLPWREDSSNGLDKYKRNRVRNELMPLMADIAGGESILEKRLDQLMHQSSELQIDLEARAKIYLQDTVDGYFPLPDSPKLNVVEKEALHMWATERMKTLPYDQLMRICYQLQYFTIRKQWTLHVGGGWNVIRNGKILDMKHESLGITRSLEDQLLSWSICVGDGKREDSLVIRIASKELSFVRSTAAKARNWFFTPSWRVDNHSIKLKDFLRGQDIPLHLRENISIIHVVGTETMVAVQVGDDQWILDASFDPSEGSGYRVQLAV